ncbi:fructose-1 6-bisphosphatase chloroplastic [Phtheirospermum japonicum]|uniref:fructose-bisphosphatase n=1 Tax=Phtheirospermum japonicum TaxID=374723 RepID=A0A830BG74_9LAMI|nr:fructose-1 6-bisphosphatase chloroplastic [Phtheirospermum japonicum]
MAGATATTTASHHHLLFSSSQPISRSSPFQTLSCSNGAVSRKRHLSVTAGRGGVRCMAVAEGTETRKKSGYEIQTLTNWLLRQEQAGVIDAELTIVLSSISMACKQIASLVQRASISNLTGVQGAVNVQGEDQKKLDVVSNEVFSNCLRSSGRTGIIASEEEDVPVAVEESYSGNYIVVFDPLDGSSNIDAAVSTGSIFGIYSPNDECHVEEDATLDTVVQKCVVNVCQPGDNLLAAGYCMYSSSIIFVITLGKGVFAFTLDPMFGEFVLTQEHVQIPKSGKIYSFNEGNYQLWDDKLKKYIDDLKDPGPTGKPYSARYIGSLVGDFHRTLLYGGIYGYPRDKKSKNGKLRLLYECAPMSFIVEQAGGKGSDGHHRVLDIQPTEIHQRVPLYIGSVDEHVRYVPDLCHNLISCAALEDGGLESGIQRYRTVPYTSQQNGVAERMNCTLLKQLDLDQAREKCIISVCQPGSNLLAAGYCLYSSSVVFTISIGRGVYAFTLDPTYGEFVLTHENIKIPDSGRIYSFNEGNYDLFDEKAAEPGSNLLAAGYCLYSSSVVFTISIGRGVYAFTLDPTYGEFVLTHENIKIPDSGRIYSFNEGNYDLFDEKAAEVEKALLIRGINPENGPCGQASVDISRAVDRVEYDNRKLDQAREKCIISVCQPGSNLLAAGYCLYSSSVVFTISIGRGVYAFTLDPTYGEFVLTHENIKIPDSGRIYSFNEGNYDLFDEKLQKYLDDLRKPGPNGKPYSGRYIGCLVGEIHRMLLVGGIYGNPDNKNSKNGNLRLLYECAPMSYLIEQAGGKAIDGQQRILDIMPTEIHQRTPIFVGSPDEVDKLVKYLSNE